MNCPECAELLQQRLDGQDDVPESLDLHLSTCRDCRELHAAAELLEHGLLALPHPVPPPGLADRIVARVLAEQPVQQLRQRRVVLHGGVCRGLAAPAHQQVDLHVHQAGQQDQLAEVDELAFRRAANPS